MKLLLQKPTAAIAKNKNPKEMRQTIEILLISTGLIGLAVFIAAGILPLQIRLATGVFVFSLSTLGTVLYAFLLQTVMTNLGGKGKYYHALTAITFAKFPMAVGVLAASILFNFSIAGIMLAAIVLLVALAMGASTLFRGVKDFFGVDIVTAWLGIGIIVLVSVATVYILIIGMFTVNQGILPLMTRGLY